MAKNDMLTCLNLTLVNISSIFDIIFAMRATKKRADVIYNVLLKHFKVDEFLVRYSTPSKKIFICASKNNRLYNLDVCYNRFGCMRLEFRWATKYISTKCSSLLTLQRGDISLKHFFDVLKDVSYVSSNLDLIDIKHELVKQILSSLRQYWYIYVRAEGIAMYGSDYMVDKIMNLEKLVIQEELNAEVNKDNVLLI